jgi:serine/threonine protein kinase
VLEVLAYLHAQRPPVLHRDVKPANLVVMADGEVALIDFDCARRGLVDKAATDPNDLSTAYTLAYAPPEQSIGLEPSPSADVYALAVSMLYAGTGIHPIQHWRAGEGRMRAPERFEPAFAALLDWMMAPGRDARCPSAEAALARLKTIA